MEGITESLADLDRQIDRLEHLTSMATECEFWELARLLSKDLLDARLGRAVIAMLLPPAQEGAECSPSTSC